MADISSKLLQMDRDQEEAQVKQYATRLGLPYMALFSYELDPDVLKIVPHQIIESLQCIPLRRDNTSLTLGVVTPDATAVKQGLSELQQMTGLGLKLTVISPSSFAYAHKTYELTVKENEGEKPVVITEKQHQELKALIEQLKSGADIPNANVTDVLSAIMAEAIRALSSDVHFEPTVDTLNVRFRIDGVLHQVMSLPTKSYHGLISRIKYLAKLPLGAATGPQDGRFTITVEQTPLDLRVASLPTVYGEMITVRILRKDQVRRKLIDLGLRSDLEKTISTQLHKPHGMIVVTGPTGSGKTTTLYALVQELNTEERKIITIEDPVEYKIDGLEQSQVDPEGGYGFVEALRGALRQDPDVIMVGEIRDQETASIAIRAALTGHIVLATMHTNNAPSTFSRLLEMGVEPFLFSGSVNVIVAERLLRLLCPTCKKAHAPSSDETAWLEQQLGRVPAQVYEAVGCDQCGNIGYRGRTGIFEALTPSHQMEELALHHSSISIFIEQAYKDGMITMLQDGLLKVEQGTTSIAEVLRVTSD